MLKDSWLTKKKVSRILSLRYSLLLLMLTIMGGPLLQVFLLMDQLPYRFQSFLLSALEKGFRIAARVVVSTELFVALHEEAVQLLRLTEVI